MTNGESTAPTDAEVARTAARAAEAHVFDRLDRSAVEDIDITTSFADGILEVDVYLHAPTGSVDTETVADEAARAGRTAVDELLEN
ncbi:MAG: DUF3194 domain-containing protein [Salinirussus sp.]